MRISHKKKFIFYSIPKTGSESVRALLELYSDEKVVTFRHVSKKHPFYSHMRPQELCQAFDEKGLSVKDYFSFATVRNPWARMASLYLMVRRNFIFRGRVPFKEWLYTVDPENLIDKPTRRKWYDHGLLNYSSFLQTSGNDGQLDAVIRIEDGIDGIANLLADRLCIEKFPTHLGRINSHNRGQNYAELYDDETVELVRKMYEKDIASYGYEFVW